LLLIVGQLVWFSPSLAQTGVGTSTASAIRAMLTDEPRWMMEWYTIDTPLEKSSADTRFEVVDGKVVAHFSSPVFGRCNRELAIADDGFGFPGCWSGLPHALKFDPNDRQIPFKERRGHRMYILRPLK
jgi:hypothetical protein